MSPSFPDVRVTFRVATAVATGLLLVTCAVTVAGLVTGRAPLWLAMSVALLTATTGVALLGMRELRRRLNLTERRLRDLESRRGAAGPIAFVAETPFEGRDRKSPRAAGDDGERLALLERKLAVAVTLLEAAGGPRAGARTALGADDALVAVDALLARGDVLDADAVVARYDLMNGLSLVTRRLMARGLRARGYLTRSMGYFRAAAAIGDRRDATQVVLRQEEVDVMSGAFVPAVATLPLGPTVVGRVLHVVGRALPDTQSGYTLRTHGIARAQALAGAEPHVFVQLGLVERDIGATDEVDGVLYHRPAGESVFTSGRRAWLQNNAEALLDVVLRVRPEVLHAHSDFHNAMLATAVGRATGIPVVYETRGFWEETWLSRTSNSFGWEQPQAVFDQHGVPEAYGWRRDREAQARAASDATVTLARIMRERIELDGGGPGDVAVVPNAVDPALFVPSDHRRDLRSELGIPSQATVIGSVTSVVEYEGLDLLVEAFEELSALTARPVWLHVVGDGAALPSLRAEIEDRGLTNVTLVGRVPHTEVADHLDLLDVFVVPRRDAEVCRLVTPLKPFEALAAGTALVMSDVAALREIAEDCGSAHLFAADDAGDLSGVLRELVEADDTRAALGERGAAWVRENRSWAASAQAYERIYTGVRRSREARRA